MIPDLELELFTNTIDRAVPLVNRVDRAGVTAYDLASPQDHTESAPLG